VETHGQQVHWRSKPPYAHEIARQCYCAVHFPVFPAGRKHTEVKRHGTRGNFHVRLEAVRAVRTAVLWFSAKGGPSCSGHGELNLVGMDCVSAVCFLQRRADG
jgi:hypothetical protein